MFGSHHPVVGFMQSLQPGCKPPQNAGHRAWQPGPRSWKQGHLILHISHCITCVISWQTPTLTLSPFPLAGKPSTQPAGSQLGEWFKCCTLRCVGSGVLCCACHSDEQGYQHRTGVVARVGAVTDSVRDRKQMSFWNLSQCAAHVYQCSNSQQR